MFSRALFKQSCKANGMMWIIITFAVCFMLACVMLISGTGNISKVKNGVQDTIIVGEIDANMEKRAINYYNISLDGLKKYDSLFIDGYKEVLPYSTTFDSWALEMPKRSDYLTVGEYNSDVLEWQNNMPLASTATAKIYAMNFSNWLKLMPDDETYDAWLTKRPIGSTAILGASISCACLKLQNYELEYAETINPNYTAESTEAQEIIGVVMYNINPNGKFDEFYTNNNEEIPDIYNYGSLLTNISDDSYLNSQERRNYINERSKICSSIFLAGNMTSEENVTLLLNELEKYNVDKKKYESFGYTYEHLKHEADTMIISYQARFEYELGLINASMESGEYANAEEYQNAIVAMQNALTADLTDSLMTSLPSSVSSAISDIGKMDLYGLIVGSIFFKMAGLLLPIIYMIMASNNLIVGQVDSGSMAYILSTSTKRRQVTFTQASFLVLSLFAMFICTTITSMICFSIVDIPDTDLSYLKLIALNGGSFLALFAMSGLCFFTSCIYDRSKRSMAIGGGLSMFFLVATMLGLFGSKVIPSVIRLEALNYFNYVSIITLFDSVSIVDGTFSYIWKLVILLALGLIGYIAGSIRFEKKDLPL